MLLFDSFPFLARYVPTERTAICFMVYPRIVPTGLKSAKKNPTLQ